MKRIDVHTHRQLINLGEDGDYAPYTFVNLAIPVDMAKVIVEQLDPNLYEMSLEVEEMVNCLEKGLSWAKDRYDTQKNA